jgi:hypothetical protein
MFAAQLLRARAMKAMMPNSTYLVIGRKIVGVTLTMSACLAWPAWAALTANSGNGTVSDSSTSLVWDQCAYGLSGSNCSLGAASLLTWPQALAAAVAANAASYKGVNDWRVPNFNELESITRIDSYTPGEPTIDAVVFPATPLDGFWTSTTDMLSPNGAWAVSFDQGYAAINFKTGSVYLRLVRGGQVLAAFDLLSTSTDTTPPVTIGPTVNSGPTQTTAGISVTIDEAGTGYWLRLPAASAAPSVAAVVSTGTSLAMSANTQASISLSGLTANTAYKLYFVAKDTADNLQAAVSSVSFTTTVVADTTPPVTTTGPTVSSGPTSTAAGISVAINEAGTGYWLLLPATSAAPSVATVTSTGTSFAMSANTTASIGLNSLTASSAYMLYFVAKDTANNTQASTASMAFSTTAASVQMGEVASVPTLSEWGVIVLSGLMALTTFVTLRRRNA